MSRKPVLETAGPRLRCFAGFVAGISPPAQQSTEARLLAVGRIRTRTLACFLLLAITAQEWQKSVGARRTTRAGRADSENPLDSMGSTWTPLMESWALPPPVPLTSTHCLRAWTWAPFLCSTNNMKGLSWDVPPYNMLTQPFIGMIIGGTIIVRTVCFRGNIPRTKLPTEPARLQGSAVCFHALCLERTATAATSHC